MIRLISSAQDGRSSISPATWPDGISPASGWPSAIAARSSTGVFAAISDLAPGQPGAAAHRAALAQQRGPPKPGRPAKGVGAAGRAEQAAEPPGSFQALGQRRAQQPVRHPIGPGGDHGAGDIAGQVRLLHRIRHRAFAGQQEPGAHGDPGGAVGERGGQAPAVEEPARRDDRDVDRVHDLGDQQAGRHRPHVPAALGPGGDHRVDAPGRHLLRVPARADRGDRDHPGVPQPADELLRRSLRERGHRHLLRDDQPDLLGRIGRVGAQVHAERRPGPLPDLIYCTTQFRGAHCCRGENAEPACGRNRRRQPRPGHVPHPGGHDGAGDAEQLGQPGPDQPVPRGTAGGRLTTAPGRAARPGQAGRGSGPAHPASGAGSPGSRLRRPAGTRWPR